MFDLSKQQSGGVYELFILALCTYVLFALALMEFFDLDPSVMKVLEYVDFAVCIVFLIDFLKQLFTAESKLQYMKWGWIDLISSIPAVGPLRWGRLARVVRILRLLRGVKSAKVILMYTAKRRADSTFSAAVLIALLAIVSSSIAILNVERTHPGATIKTAEDAMWWATATITTVGYGDKYPVSTGGRFVGVATMTVGVGLFATFTAFVATWFIEPGERKQDDELESIRASLVTIERQLDLLLEQRK